MPPLRFALFSLSLFLCLFAQTAFAEKDKSDSQDEIPFPQCLIDHMADRTMRYHHYLWHQVRADWNLFDALTKESFTAIGWVPPNPSRDHKAQPITDNYAGEDFLYMHVHMVAHANQIIAEHNDPYGPLKSWSTIPGPEDTVDPVPAPYANFKSAKTDEFYELHIRQAEEKLKDPDQLRNMTLNQLGHEIETGIHAAMHNRWSSESPVGYREGCSFKNGELPYVNKKWDDPSYNWLIDTYSAHVNPVFWKLHGWINERVEDWRKANGLETIDWKGTWTGGPMETLENALIEQELRLPVNTEGADYESEPVGRSLQSGVPETRFAGDF